MKKLTLTIALFLLTIFTLMAQGVEDNTIRKNSIDLQFGSGLGYLKDLNYSPINHSSGGLVVNSGYQRYLKSDNRLFFSANFQFGELNTAVSEYNTSDHYNINLELGFLKNIPINASEIKILLGGQYHSYFDIVFYEVTRLLPFTDCIV